MLPGPAGSSASRMSRRTSMMSLGTDFRLNHNSNGQLALMRYIRRVIYYPQMDFEYTREQMLLLLRSPSKVYKLAAMRNQTKAQWARDDPAFVVLLVIGIAIATFCYALALGNGSFSSMIVLVAVNTGIFFISGICMASFWWWIANVYFRVSHSHSVKQEVEWLYAFDIHCNGYWPLFVSLYVVQFLLLPVLLNYSIMATLCANVIYAASLSYYSYISFLGFMYLPFLNKEMVTSMLYPIVGVVIVFVLLTVLNVNATRYTLSFFFVMT